MPDPTRRAAKLRRARSRPGRAARRRRWPADPNDLYLRARTYQLRDGNWQTLYYVRIPLDGRGEWRLLSKGLPSRTAARLARDAKLAEFGCSIETPPALLYAALAGVRKAG